MGSNAMNILTTSITCNGIKWRQERIPHNWLSFKVNTLVLTHCHQIVDEIGGGDGGGGRVSIAPAPEADYVYIVTVNG